MSLIVFLIQRMMKQHLEIRHNQNQQMGTLSTTIKQKIIPSQPQPIRVLLRGLSESGKTTILYKLATGVPQPKDPEIPVDFRVQLVRINQSIVLQIWDVSGCRIKEVCHAYYASFRALVWVVDATDLQRLDFLRKELDQTIFHEKLRDTVVMILANKQELMKTSKSFMDNQFLVQKLELDHLTQQNRVWKIFSCSALQMSGFNLALDWLGESYPVNDLY